MTATTRRTPISSNEVRLSDLSMQLDVSVVSTLVGILSADWKGRRACGGSPDASRVERKISYSVSQSRSTLRGVFPYVHEY